MLRRALLLGLAVTASLGGAALLALAGVYLWLGHTPGRWMDYAERRLQGHPRLEAVALPVIGWARVALDEPSAAQRAAEPFVAPPPPARWGADEAVPSPAPGDGARTLRVGPGAPILTIAEAARLARDGDVVEIQAGDYRGDVAVWRQKRLTIRGVGGNARLHAGGRAAEGKAIWVLRNGDFDIANIDFVGARVQDRNGAGIRFEGGRLRVRNCLFWDSESGILSSSGPAARDAVLEIERSEFGYLGDGVGMSHHVYVGDIALFRVTGSYFHHGNVGHLIKSRARVNDIRYNRITDEPGGRASYEIDLPNGGVAFVVGNLIQQDRRPSNAALISFGQEGYIGPVHRLYLMNNTLVNDRSLAGAFLRAKAGATNITVVNNVRVGFGRYQADDALQVENDVEIERSALEEPDRFDYRLTPAAAQKARFARPVVDRLEGFGLVPEFEYRHPRRLVKLESLPAHAGALQSAAAHPR